MAAPLQDSSLRAERSGQRLAVVPRPGFAGQYAKGSNKIERNQYSKGSAMKSLPRSLRSLRLFPPCGGPTRCCRVNAWCLLHGKKNAICISIHFNAHGNGYEWTKASGWSIYTSKGNTAADELADCIAEAAKINLPTMRLRCDLQDGDFDYEEDFYILRKTLCPCVLSENGFMTNEKECRWLQTEEALSAIVKTHVEGIVNYLATL